MFRDDAVALIQSRLGNRTGLEAKCISELQFLQTQLEHAPALPKFLLTVYSSSATGNVFSPPGLLRIDEDGGVWVADANSELHQLTKRTAQEMNLMPGLQGFGLPKAYRMVGKTLSVAPVPDQSYIFTAFYYKSEPALTTNIENQWLLEASDLMVGGAGLQVATFLRDEIAAQMFKAMRDEAVGRLFANQTANEVSDEAMYVGG